MSLQAFFGGMMALVLLICWWGHVVNRSTGWASVCGIAAVMFGYWSYEGTTPEHLAKVAADEKAAQERERREMTPHVIREADGCKVYAWKGGDSKYHYFTRCPNSQTSTTRNYTECTGTGKTRSCQEKSETIEVRQ